jgi:hypothetical protein
MSVRADMGRTLVSSDSEERPVRVEMDSGPIGSDAMGTGGTSGFVKSAASLEL